MSGDGGTRAKTKQRHDDTLLVGDATLEALQGKLLLSGGAATIEVDELAVFLKGMGEYKSSRANGDFPRVLSLWSGEPLRVIRVSRGDLLIPNPTVCVVGGLVPAAHELLGGPDDGFRPRWLPHYAGTGPDVDQPATHATPEWTKLLTTLLMYRGNFRIWRLTAAADKVFLDAQKRWREQSHGAETAGVSAALLKADFHLLRIAEVIAESENPGRGGAVREDVIERAAEWVDYTLNCWRALPEQSGLAESRRDEVLYTRVDAIRNYTEQHGPTTKRALRQARVGAMRTNAELTTALNLYAAVYGQSRVQVTPHCGGDTTLVLPPGRELLSDTNQKFFTYAPSGSHNGVQVTPTPDAQEDQEDSRHDPLKELVSLAVSPRDPLRPNGVTSPTKAMVHRVFPDTTTTP